MYDGKFDAWVLGEETIQAKRIIDKWVGFHNSDRPHTALEKRTPGAAYFDETQIRTAV